MLRFTAYMLAFIGIFASCRPKPIDIDIPQLEPKVVVFSQAVPNQILLVILTRSFGALEFKDGQDSLTSDLIAQIAEDSALITISYLGETDTLFEVTSGVYATFNTLQYTDQPYTLNIYTNREEHLISTSTMLAPVLFDAVTPIITRTNGDTTVKLKYEFTDLPDKNFYMVHVYSPSQADTNALDPNMLFAQGTNVLRKSKLLSDQTFETAFFSDTLNLPNVQASDSIAVTISNISETYYNYLVLRERSANWLTQILQEPVNYPTNIQGGGYGFFNTHYPDVRFFDLNQY